MGFCVAKSVYLSLIIFVDRYFDGGVKHGKPLSAFLAEAFQGVQPIRIEYHCDDRASFGHFAFQINKMDIFSPLPSGYRLRFVRWKQIPEGDSPHPRYILTDWWGLRYDYGFSEDDGVTTDISILGSESYDRRMGEFTATKEAFEFVDRLELLSHHIYKLENENGCYMAGAEMISE